MLKTRWIAPSALVAYSLPWVVNTGAALTLNAYDLAEWLSLHPVMRSAHIPLAATFALRVLLLLVVALILFDKDSTAFERLAFPVIIALALLPPLDFFRTGLSDPNFRQQFGLSIGTLLLIVLSRIRWLRHRSALLQILTGIAAIVLSIYALATGIELMRGFGLAVHIGLGSMLFIVIMIGGLVKFCEATFAKLPRHSDLSTEIPQL